MPDFMGLLRWVASFFGSLGGQGKKVQRHGGNVTSRDLTPRDHAQMRAEAAARAQQAAPEEGDAGAAEGEAPVRARGPVVAAPARGFQPWMKWAGIGLAAVVGLLIVLFVIIPAIGRAFSGVSLPPSVTGGTDPTGAPAAGQVEAGTYPAGKQPNAVGSVMMGIVNPIQPAHKINLLTTAGMSVTLEAEPTGAGFFVNGQLATEPTISETLGLANFTAAGIMGHVDGPAYQGGIQNPENQRRVIFGRPQENINVVFQTGETIGLFAQDSTKNRETYIEVTYLGEGRVHFEIYKAPNIGAPGVKIEPKNPADREYNVAEDAIELSIGGNLARFSAFTSPDKAIMYMTIPLAAFNADLEPTPVPTVEVTPEPATPEATAVP